MRIDVLKISEKEKLTIQKGLLDYKYIMNNWSKNDRDFQDVYYEFYLKARSTMRGDSYIKKTYFDLLLDKNLENDLLLIIEKLEKTSKTNEFSICSKLLHTRFPDNPIYDSKVRNYLIKDENVKLWWGDGGKGAPRDITGKEKIAHDWKLICEWYKDFLESEDGSTWISWFDNCFPEYVNISDYKKVDFIIFATR